MFCFCFVWLLFLSEKKFSSLIVDRINFLFWAPLASSVEANLDYLTVILNDLVI